MFTSQQKVLIIKTFYETKDYHTVRSVFRKTFNLSNGTKLPSRHEIYRIIKKFELEASLNSTRKTFPGGYNSAARTHRATIIEETVKEDPRTSVRKMSRVLQIPKSTIHDTLKKKMKLKAYKIKFFQSLSEGDPAKRVDFANAVLNKPVNFTKRIFFSDEATFSLDGQVNTQNVRIWGSEPPEMAYQTYSRNSPKINVFCAMSHNRVIGPYFFDDVTVNGSDYLNMLTTWLFQRLPPNNTFIFQQDGAPPHWALQTRAFLNQQLPKRWIGRAAARDQCLLPWPPRSPDLTPLDFFLVGFCERQCL